MARPSEQLYPSTIEPKHLARFDLLTDSDSDSGSRSDVDSIPAVLSMLQGAGLQAKQSKRDPATILGGTNARPSSMGLVFERAFTIEPAEARFVAVVTGPGNLCREWRLATRREAAQRVIQEYRERGELASPSRM